MTARMRLKKGRASLWTALAVVVALAMVATMRSAVAPRTEAGPTRWTIPVGGTFKEFEEPKDPDQPGDNTTMPPAPPHDAGPRPPARPSPPAVGNGTTTTPQKPPEGSDKPAWNIAFEVCLEVEARAHFDK